MTDSKELNTRREPTDKERIDFLERQDHIISPPIGEDGDYSEHRTEDDGEGGCTTNIETTENTTKSITFAALHYDDNYWHISDGVRVFEGKTLREAIDKTMEESE